MNLLECEQLVSFINTNKSYSFNSNKPKDILVEFVVNPKMIVALGKDWVAIFPKDSKLESPINKSLNQLVTFEYVMQRPATKEEKKYIIKFDLCEVKNLQFGQEEYKFVYCNAEFEILGVSDAFKIFDLTSEVESLQHNIRNVSLMGNSRNRKNPKTKGNQKNTRTSRDFVDLQDGSRIFDSSVHSVTENRSYNVGYNMSNPNNWDFNQVQPPTSFPQPVLSPRCLPANNSCNNCSRVGSLLSTQSELYMQVKNLAEEKQALIHRVSCLEKQVELGQAAYQKQSVLLLQEREMRINYQREVEILKSYQEYMCDSPNNNRVADCKKQTGGTQSLLMRLKAMVGNQEKKIRSLTEKLVKEEQQVQLLSQKLTEVQVENIRKVKIVEKEVEAIPKNVCSATQSYNNNEGEETSDID